jgi:hypothetical protein
MPRTTFITRRRVAEGVRANALEDPIPSRDGANLTDINGASLTNLNASQLLSGTVPLARLSGILNAQIDAAAAIDFSKLAATVIFPGVSSPTTTGSVTNLTSSGIHTYRFNNASDVTIHGIAAGVQGQQMRFISVGAGNMYFANQSSTEGTAAARLINAATVGLTPLAAGKGIADYEYDGTTQRWRLVNHVQGEFIAIPYNAADYGGSGAMTWTIDNTAEYAVHQAYLQGKNLTINYNLQTTDVGGVADLSLQVKYPWGHTAQTSCRMLAVNSNAGGALTFGYVLSTIGTADRCSFRRDAAGTNWTLTTGDNTSVSGTLIFAVN